MNGVPNSPVYRYVQVESAQIQNNSIINSARVSLAAGADAERSAPPINSKFERNLLVFNTANDPVTIEDDISGIAFNQNVISSPKAKIALDGYKASKVVLKRAANGLLYPAAASLKKIGAPRDLTVISLADVGAKWHPKSQARDTFGSGKTIAVSPGDGTLDAAFAAAKDGDRLILAAGEYSLERTLAVDKAVSIEGAAGARPLLLFQRDMLFELSEGGSLRLKDIDIDGKDAVDYVGNAMLRTSRHPITSNFQIEMEGVNIRNLIVNKSFDVIALGKSTMADNVKITNSSFTDISGKVISADSETDDFGRYNIEYLNIANSKFKNIGGAIVSLYRGGNDESTFGPHFLFENNVVDNNKADVGTFKLLGVQQALIQNNQFSASAPINITQTTGIPIVQIINNSFARTPHPAITEAKYVGPQRVVIADNSFDGIQQ
jgi:poly(beta-D-mannuronate) lyase